MDKLLVIPLITFMIFVVTGANVDGALHKRLEVGEVISIEVISQSVESRIFRITDGYEEKVMEITYLGEDYIEYFMCPKIDRIERVRGDTRNHIIHASAVNYSGHHGGLYDKINFIVSDTVKDGIEILEVKMQKNISVEESIKQCK